MRAAAEAHNQDTTAPVVSWPTALYELAAEPTSGRYGEQLAVCTAHDGQHVLHGRPGDHWCAALPPHGKRREHGR